MTFERGRALMNWLRFVEPSTAQGLNVNEAQHSVTRVNPPTRSFLSATNPNENNLPAILHLTFDTPVTVPVANQCGRVAFSDMHVSSGTGERSDPSLAFPTGCTGRWSPQARALEFLIYDLACVDD